MLAQPLPDGRMPVLLSAHDETLIGQDARAILDYLDRAATDHDPTAAVASTLLRLRRVRRHRARGAGGGPRRTGRRPVRAGPRRRASAGRPVLEKRCASTSHSCFPGRATNGSRWEPTPTGGCRHTGPRPTAARRRSPRPGCRRRCPTCWATKTQNWSRTQIQGAQFIHAVSLAPQWRFCGVLPDITIGHSLGEVAAAYVAEKISLPDAVALVGARAAVVDRLTGHYAMAVLGVRRRRGQGADRRDARLAGGFGGQRAVGHGGVR